MRHRMVCGALAICIAATINVVVGVQTQGQIPHVSGPLPSFERGWKAFAAGVHSRHCVGNNAKGNQKTCPLTSICLYNS
jgi:hypothetical protein